MLIASVAVIGALLVGLFILAMVRRRDAEAAVGVLSRETAKRDRANDAMAGLLTEKQPVSGRQIERQAAREWAGRTSTAVAVTSTLPVPAGPPRAPDPEVLGVTRRQFLNRAILGVLGLSLAGLGTAVVGFLWPVLEPGGFGSVILVGDVTDINATIATKQPFYSPEARAYLNPYPPIDLPKAKLAGYSDPILAGMQLGYVALYQKCPHLGCRVPWCQSSQWFECPCHGSQYNRVGEKKGGPAPRGMDRFALAVSSTGSVSINTSTVFVGPAIGTNTTGQEAEGPHCV